MSSAVFEFSRHAKDPALVTFLHVVLFKTKMYNKINKAI